MSTAAIFITIPTSALINHIDQFLAAIGLATIDGCIDDITAVGEVCQIEAVTTVRINTLDNANDKARWADLISAKVPFEVLHASSGKHQEGHYGYIYDKGQYVSFEVQAGTYELIAIGWPQQGDYYMEAAYI